MKIMKKLSIIALILITGSIGLFANSVEKAEDPIKMASIGKIIKQLDTIYDESIQMLHTTTDRNIILSLMQEAEDKTITVEKNVQTIITKALGLLSMAKEVLAANSFDKYSKLLSELGIQAASKRIKMIELAQKVKTEFFEVKTEFVNAELEFYKDELEFHPVPNASDEIL